mgnify:CR=1 FL=1
MAFFNGICLSLVEGDKKVGQEVPKGNHTDGKEFRQVKIHFEFSQDQPDHPEQQDQKAHHGVENESKAGETGYPLPALQPLESGDQLISHGTGSSF